MRLNKEKYRIYCEKCSDIPIFSQAWWMDAVCGEHNWDVLLVEKNGEIIASMPYYMRKKYGLKIITQPKLTQTNGIWIKYPSSQKYVKKISYEREIISNIIKQLEQLKFDYFCQNFYYKFTNWLPFYWKSYNQTTRYTYRIYDLSDLQKIWNSFNDNVRNKIRKAEKILTVKEDDLTIEEFFEINSMTFTRQGIEIPYSLEFLKRLHSACKQHNACKILYAVDDKQQIHAAIYLVWDNSTTYYLMAGENPELRKSGANNLLIWHAIRHASNVSEAFDFEGSMIETVEEFVRSFGGIQTLYFQIYKMSRRMQMLYHGRELLKSIIGAK